MKNLFFTLIFFLTTSLIASADTEKEIKAGIKHVTVYPDRAQLNHETTVEVPAGKTILRLGLEIFASGTVEEDFLFQIVL